MQFVLIKNLYIMKTVLLVTFIALALANNLINDLQAQADGCFANSKSLYERTSVALKQKNIESIIDSLQKISEDIPSFMRSCGAQEQAKSFENKYPPACTKLLAKEAKIMVKIMRLYAEDQQNNQKQIMLYTAMFETIYKTQVQKKCPFLAEQHLMEAKNKGECAEGTYRLSLTFETLDNDLMAGKFNKSLTDMGKVVEQLPIMLDSCSQHNLANFVRNNFPVECLNAIGGLVREGAAMEHKYTHFEWLEKHYKDFTKAIIQVRTTCPALEHN